MIDKRSQRTKTANTGMNMGGRGHSVTAGGNINCPVLWQAI